MKLPPLRAKSRQDRKRKQRKSVSEGIIKSKEMMPSGDLPKVVQNMA